MCKSPLTFLMSSKINVSTKGAKVQIQTLKWVIVAIKALLELFAGHFQLLQFT